VIAVSLTSTLLPPLSVQFPRHESEAVERAHVMLPPAQLSSVGEASAAVSLLPLAKVAARVHATAGHGPPTVTDGTAAKSGSMAANIELAPG